MWIRELSAHRYGVFESRRWEFHRGFQIVQGPNEAGKSTFLELVRDFFFGFPQRCRYQWHGTPTASAILGLSSDRSIECTRAKKRSRSLTGLFDNGDPLSEESFRALCGDFSRDLYSQVFGFALGELASGQEGLRRAGMSESLFGAALGGLGAVQSLQDSLQEESQSLYTERGKKRRINRTLAEIQDLKKAVREATVLPTQLEEVERQKHDAEQRYQMAQQAVAQAREEEARWKRLGGALPLGVRHDDLARQIDETAEGPDVSDATRQRFDRLESDRSRAEEEVRESTEKIQQIDGQLASIHVDTKLLDRAATIRQVAAESSRIADYERTLFEEQQTSAAQFASLESAIKDIHATWHTHVLDRVSLGLARREAMAELASRGQLLAEAIEQHRRDLQSARQEQRQLERRVASLSCQASADHLGELSELLAVLEGQHQALAQSRDDAEASLLLRDELARRLSPLVDQLSGADLKGDEAADVLRELPLPLEASIDAAEPAWTHMETEKRQIEESITSLDEEIHHHEEAIRQGQSEVDLPEEGALESARARRDRTSDLLDTLIDAAAWRRRSTSTASRQRARRRPSWRGHRTPRTPQNDRRRQWNTLRRQVRSVDRLTDRLLAHADAVARRRSHRRAAARLRRQHQRAEMQLADVKARLDTWRKDWRRLWAPLTSEARTPKEMRQWLQLHGQWSQVDRQCRLRSKRVEELHQQQMALASRIHEALQIDAPTEEPSLATLRAMLERARETLALRVEHQQGLQDATEKADQLESAIASLRDAHEQWGEAWRTTLDAAGLPPEWTPRVAEEAIGKLQQLAERREELRGRAHQLRQKSEAIDQFAESVRRLAEEVAPDLAGTTATEAADLLQRRLDEADRARQQRDQLTLQRTETDRHRARRQKELRHAEDKMRQIRAEVDAPDDAVFLRIAEAAAQRRALQLEHEQVRSQLRHAAGQEPIDEFLDRLRAVDPDRLKANHLEATDALARRQAEYDDAVRGDQEASRQLESLGHGSRAAELAMDLEAKRAELAEMVDEWAVTVLADALLTRSLERFVQANEGELLVAIRQLLARMTGGRYTGVARRLGSDELLVEDADGTEKPPEALSTGTREQLYLAMRLAYLQHYARDHEPLPVVMDDVLVNFDDVRLGHALAALAELGHDMQILMLTCHGRAAQQAAALDLEVPVVAL